MRGSPCNFIKFILLHRCFLLLFIRLVVPNLKTDSYFTSQPGKTKIPFYHKISSDFAVHKLPFGVLWGGREVSEEIFSKNCCVTSILKLGRGKFVWESEKIVELCYNNRFYHLIVFILCGLLFLYFYYYLYLFICPCPS